ncbi:helix-turn-helix domain-containing protein [Mesorhizobium sp. 1B3]|uniref:helix-turn-helix domain-containing protein n=1 Tax=Mesorhizobium sp. 1B3 TaxID=3243599 RepID=UPI003D958688
MSTAPLSGSLVFAEHDGIVCSSGLLQGRVALRGPLSSDKVTLGAGLRLEPGCWQWLTEAETGGVGIFNAADEHDSLYTPGSLYAAVTLSEERLEAEAAKRELMLDRKVLGGSGVHSRRLAQGVQQQLLRKFDLIHAGHTTVGAVSMELLSALIDHLGRLPIDHNRRDSRNQHARIVHRARNYIHEHLTEPISLDAIAASAHTSVRTLYRAFADILDDTPQIYVRRLRLHRIREGLAGDVEQACTITVIANQWGISELGRLAGWYRELFGERPSETLAQTRAPADKRSTTSKY